MDFRQLNTNSHKQESAANEAADTRLDVRSVRKQEDASSSARWQNVLHVILLFGVAAILFLMTLLFVRTGSSSYNEGGLVDSTKYQAVFLNNGQVYFGNITGLNSRYVRLNNIYYLTQATTTGQQQTSSDYTLIKLGCQQIHYPTDQMVITRDQITFWENLNKDGKVVQSIKDYNAKYPKGPDCSQVSNQTQSTTNTTTQGSTTPSNTTTNTTNSTTTNSTNR